MTIELLSPPLLDKVEGVTRHALGVGRAEANVNIALIKYWGKAESSHNVPAVGSLSLTLDEWGSDTTLYWVNRDQLKDHLIILNGEQREDHKISKLLNQALMIAQERGHPWASSGELSAVMVSHNTVPTASGLASSASGMAALGVAAWAAFGWDQDLKQVASCIQTPEAEQLIDLVRIGSGSAVRSLHGGMVRLEQDGKTMKTLCSPSDWDLALVVCVVDPGPKEVSSREGMERTRNTSPYYASWVDTHAQDLNEAEQAVMARDLSHLGELMERSTFKMHAAMWASHPPLRYIKGATLSLLDIVEQLRRSGISAWATMDAGPHVKVLCNRQDAPSVFEALSSVSGINQCLIRYPGQAVRIKRETSYE